MNEKLLWRKTYGYLPLHTQISDKYRVRSYVAEKVGEKYLIPLYQVLYSADDLNWEMLPASFIGKPNNRSGEVLAVKDKDSFPEERFRARVSHWLRSKNHFSREPEYKDIAAAVLVEKLLLDSHGRIPMDYKLHCFSGRVEIIQVDIDRFGSHRRNLYSAAWDPLPFNWSAVDARGRPRFTRGTEVEKPECLDEILHVAERLSAEFDYIRVDLYVCSGTIYFGELTLHHGGGFAHFLPPQYDIDYGSKFTLNACRT